MNITLKRSLQSLKRKDNTFTFLLHRNSSYVCLWVVLVVLTKLVYEPVSTQAAVTEAWVHRYIDVVTNSSDRASKIMRDAAGDIIVTGTTDDGTSGLDILTIKYSGIDGAVLWTKRYDGPANANDGPSALAVDGNGNVVVSGYSNSGLVFSGNPTNDYYTAKYSATDGTLLWEKRYNGPANGDDVAKALVVDSHGNVIVTGASYGGGYDAFGNPNYDYYTAKYAAADGALLWEKRYNGPADGSDGANAIAINGEDSVVVTGYSYGGASSYDYYTAMYAGWEGALLWETRYSGSAASLDGASAVAVDAVGEVVVTGSSLDGSGLNNLYCTLKYAAVNGALRWEQRTSGAWNIFGDPIALVVDHEGNVLVAFPNLGTFKYAATNGGTLWEKRITTGNGHPSAVALDGDGNVVVAGALNSGGGTYANDYFSAKYAANNGALLWERSYNGPGGNDDEATAVVVDESGDAVVTGFSSNGPSDQDPDYYTVKYAARDGAPLWAQRYNGPVHRNSEGLAIAVDGDGDVVVLASSQQFSPGAPSYYTAKYSGESGALHWDKLAAGTYYPGSLALDRSGNIVVTGSSTTIEYWSDGSLAWMTNRGGGRALAVDISGNVVLGHTGSAAKYAAVDGALLWQSRFATGEDSGLSAVAADKDGNVVVTGYLDIRTNIVYSTAKYAAGDGALLWRTPYYPSASDDYAHALALDGRGDVIVTGTSYNRIFPGSYIDSDCYTTKYAAENGALLWEQRFKGRDRAIAVDARGNVLVAGWSTNCFESGHYTNCHVLVKYAKTDGARLWERHSDASFDAIRIGVDGNGNVVMTGTSNGDYYTAKIRGEDGALIWEQRYNGPANGYDAATALALGPNGMVAVTGRSVGQSGLRAAYDGVTVVYREIPASPLFIDEVVVSEGNAGTTEAVFIVNLAHSHSEVISVDFATMDGSATAGIDYRASNGTLIFNAGETRKTITIPVLGDTLDETDETFFVMLENPTNISLDQTKANGIILDDDTVGLSITGALVLEGNSGTTNAEFVVHLNRPHILTVSVDFATAEGSALGDEDYTPSIGTVMFAPGETTKTINVSVHGDLVDENNETFFVNLSHPLHAVLTTAQAQGTIMEDDFDLTITQQPADQSVPLGSNATFTVTVASTFPPITYQWYKNGAALPEQTSPTLTLMEIGSDEGGVYTVDIFDAVNSIRSDPATLVVLFPPVVTRIARRYEIPVGGSATLSVESTGALPMGYRWRRGNTAIDIQLLYSHTSFFRILNAQPTSGGTYTVVLTNAASFNPGVLSPTISVVIVPDTDGDGMPDTYESNNGLNPDDNTDSTRDLDMDGFSNRDEYTAGTDPRNPDNYLKIERLTLGTGVNLEFFAPSNKTYTIQFNEGLDAMDWNWLRDVVGSPTSGLRVVNDPLGTDRRYYRLVTPRQP